MSVKKDDNKQYSAADIERYLTGRMSAEEMHALETTALDDPFLADAIEGFQNAMEKDKQSITAGVHELNEEFNRRIKKPARVVPITQGKWWQIAAAVLILLIAGVAYYNNWIKPELKGETLATNQKTLHDSSRNNEGGGRTNVADSARQDTNLHAASPSNEVASVPRVSNQAEADQSVKQKSSVNLKAKEQTEEPVQQNADRLAKLEEETNKPSAANDIREKQDQPAAGRSAEAIQGRTRESLNQLNNFSGRVVDPSNKPLANASIQIIQDKTNLVTDQSGQFNFSAKDSIVDVQVGMVGYEQRQYRLQNNNNATNKLVLEPSNQALEEVVVSGYGSERKKGVYNKKTSSPKDSKSNTTARAQDAVPRIGWLEYEKYLEENKKVPASNPQLKGEVVVSFEIKRPATLSDFKIEKSVSREHDLEAIRLIREGPEWKLLKGWKTRVTVTVKF